MPRVLNQATIDLVKHFEGLYLEAYRCPAGVWTIGYGHTGLVHKDGTVKSGRVITQAKADRLLAYDLGVFARGVDKLLLPRPRQEINDNQFGALVSFAFNCGLGALKTSTLLQRVNARRYADCPAEFLKWNRTAGKVLRGLTRRRQSEANLFMSLPNWLVKA
jgi:lysozyme